MRFFTLLGLFFWTGCYVCYGQQATDFPKYIDTGNKAVDAENYNTQKKAWIATHTEEYIQMQPGLSEEGKVLLRKQYFYEMQIPREEYKEKTLQVQRIAYEDFVLLSDEERAKIEVSPELFQIVKRREIESK